MLPSGSTGLFVWSKSGQSLDLHSWVSAMNGAYAGNAGAFSGANPASHDARADVGMRHVNGRALGTPPPPSLHHCLCQRTFAVSHPRVPLWTIQRLFKCKTSNLLLSSPCHQIANRLSLRIHIRVLNSTRQFSFLCRIQVESAALLCFLLI